MVAQASKPCWIPFRKVIALASPIFGTAKSLALTALPFLALAAVSCGSDSGGSSNIDDPSTADATTGGNTTGAGTTTSTAQNSAASGNGTTTGATTGNAEDTSTGASGAGATTTRGTTAAETTSTGAGGTESTSNVTTTTSGTGAGGSGGTGDPPIDELPETNCTVNVMTSEVADIATVGVVTFSADLPGITSAQIQFGKDTSYGQAAPVNLDAADYRTLLLGMTQDSTYNYRIAVSDGSQVCYSDNQTLETGSLDVDDLADVSIGEGAPSGFIVTSRGSDVIIFNEAGELVWGHSFGGGIFSAQMSWDGQYMFARDTGPFDAASGGTFRRVGMDGSGEETMDAPGGDHHDFTAIPEGIAYIGKTAAGECDQVFIASNDITDGEPLFDTWQIFEYFTSENGGGGGGQGELCHANRIHYFAESDIFTVSDRNKDAIAIFERDGTPITSIGTTPSGGWTQHIQAEGAGSDWQAQHGHHFYADDKLLVFTNEGDGGSAMLHYTIDGGSATLDWSYTAAGTSRTQGDVQYLPNGTFLVTASNAGTIHLLDASQNLISSYTAAAGGGGGMGGGMGGFGYTWFRPTLYGPPPSR